jgi:hypothetical protein
LSERLIILGKIGIFGALYSPIKLGSSPLKHTQKVIGMIDSQDRITPPLC